MTRRIGIISAAAAVLGLASSITGLAWAAVADQSGAQAGYSAPALYNLGNSYARSAKPALAELNYERALVLAPADPDIRANLRAVRESAGLPGQVDGWLSRHIRLIDPNAMYWLGLIGLTLAGTGFILRRVRPGHGAQFGAAAAAVGLVLTALCLGDAAATASILHESVVLSAAPASAAPIAGTSPLFTVLPAELVRVREEHQGFALIRDSKGRQGWVVGTHLAPVIPPGNGSTGAAM